MTDSPKKGFFSRRASQEDKEKELPKVEELTLSPSPSDESKEPEVSGENRQGLLKVLAQAIGFDITSISLPVSLNEPQSFLMRLCEGAQYSDLLDKAAACESSTQRLMYVSLFAISFYSSAERTGKPFNPLLGETFEYLDEKRNNLRFIAEQVSHHPPVGACHAETDTWKYWMSQCLKTKFAGNSLDCYVVGSNHVYLKETNEHFKWYCVKTSVNNVIVGKLWLDHFGETSVFNKTNGEVAKLRFKQCGWFSAGWHEVDGEIFDSKGQSCITLSGKWNESVFAKLNPAYDSDSQPGTPTSGTPVMDRKDEKKAVKQQEKDRKKDLKDFKRKLRLSSTDPLWVHSNRPLDPAKLPIPNHKYMVDWTAHTVQIAEFPESMRAILPPTDSRLRADRLALEKADVKAAGAAKYAMEEKQRAEKRKRDAEKGTWVPRYFKISQDEDGEDFWEYQGGYWEERDKRVLAANQ